MMLTCPVCSSIRIKNKLDDERFNYKIYSCLYCRLIFKRGTNDIVYEDLDFDSYNIYNFSRKKEVYEIIKILKHNFADIHKISILEIGCGTGSLLNEFKNFGIKNIQGIEPNAKAVDYAKNNFNLDVHCDYFRHDVFQDKVDVILLYDVLEHLKSPHELFQEISKYMNSNTLLIVKTGNTSSINANIYFREWQYIHSKQHLCFYNKQSLKKLLDLHNLEIKNFISFKDAYGGIHLKKLISNIVKGLLVKVLFILNIYVSPSKNYSLALANDHFIATIIKTK